MINANDWRMPITIYPGLYRKVIVDYTAPLEKGQVFDLNGHYECKPCLSVLERGEGRISLQINPTTQWSKFSYQHAKRVAKSDSKDTLSCTLLQEEV